MAQIRRNMTLMHARARGNLGEDIACKFIISKGFSVICRNYQKKWGELDIIAVKDDILHFFEVKSVLVDGNDQTHAEKSGHRPEENVHAQKVRHLRRIIETYLAESHRGEDKPFEVHVLSVFMDWRTRRARIQWLRNIIL